MDAVIPESSDKKDQEKKEVCPVCMGEIELVSVPAGHRRVEVGHAIVCLRVSDNDGFLEELLIVVTRRP